MTIQDFLSRLTNITRAPWNGGKAPHKPVLLLALADWFDKHQPTDNHLPFDEDLVSLFKENWNLLVPNHTYKADLITKPFYYLKTDGFWTPFHKHGLLHEAELRSPKRLYEANAAGRLTDEAFRFFQQMDTRELIRMKLLDAFFPDTKH
ncbi:MAG: hypothetical protein IPM82_28285 [Saprospiraceae bacterium]|nr:hypothetical protein [Saprospiraceae bacterium]